MRRSALLLPRAGAGGSTHRPAGPGEPLAWVGRYSSSVSVACVESEPGIDTSSFVMRPAALATRTIATNHPAPCAPRPVILGFANAAMDWGGTRWATFVWPMLAAAAPLYGIVGRSGRAGDDRTPGSTRT